jgi:formylglycine-generating enzyme required for sulfatase activity
VATPAYIPFQGLVTTSAGQLVPDGSYAVIFNIYADAVGGQPLWTERHTKVGVINGQLNVFLGSIPGNSVPVSSLDFATVKYLGITIDTDGVPTTPDPEMVPRQLLTPAFYALRAANADKLAGYDWSALFSGGNPQTGTIAGTRIIGGTITASQLQADLARSQLLSEGVDSQLASVPASATLASGGYARETGSLNVGGATFYAYRYSASPVDRFTLATAATTGTEFTDGQAAPVDLGAVTGASTSIVLHVRNLGTRALAGLTATIDGANAAEFSYAFGSTSVPIGDTTTLTITGISVFGIQTAAIHVSATGITNAFDLNLAKTTAVPANFSLIPSGAFTMGRTSGDTDTDAPPVTVTVSAFVMQKTETTKALWDDVRTWATSNGYTDLAAGADKAANHPVQTVSWWDVVKWCNARSEKEGLTPCYTVAGGVMRIGTTAPNVNWDANGYRLPTEAEWEKAARGGVAGKRFPWGTDTIRNGPAASGGQANYFGLSTYAYDLGPDFYNTAFYDTIKAYTAPVGSFAANGYGLHDMAGNVFEWCWDWYGAGSYVNGDSNPKGVLSGTFRVLRGGSWSADRGGGAFNARCSNRISRTPGITDDDDGFRPARGRP